MIKIIKQPTKIYQDQIVQKHFRCRYCGTEWIADPAEYETRRAGVWRNDIEQYNYLTICPICGQYHCFKYCDEGKSWEDIPYNQADIETFY